MPVDINHDIIDLKTLCRVIAERKKSFIILQLVVVAIMTLYFLTTPKVYRTHVEIAPEISTDQNNNVTNVLRLLTQTNFVNTEIDAIYPLMYPTVVESDNFTADLFDVKISTADGKVHTTYYDYLLHHTDIPLWRKPIRWVTRLLKGDKPSETAPVQEQSSVVKLTKQQSQIMTRIQNNITCVVDRKMGIITLVVKDQDPMVCTLMADSIAAHLKDFIIQYRTNKAHIDYQFCTTAYNTARQNYQKAQEELLKFSSSHISVDRADLRIRLEKLQNEVNNYRLIMEAADIQRYSARAKIQECTPVFSIIRKPYFPNEPYSPKIAISLVYALIIGNVLMLGFIFRKRLLQMID